MAGLLAAPSYATLTFSNPITVDSAGVVGAAEFLSGDGGGSPATIQPVAQHLLDMAANTDEVFGGRSYSTSVTEYSGTIALANSAKDDSGNLYVPSGFEYVVGKYDGENAGYVLFYLGGEDAYLPATSANIWLNGQGNGYELSGWTAYNVVPEPTTIIAGALLLLPFGASTIRFLRKNRTA